MATVEKMRQSKQEVPNELPMDPIWHMTTPLGTD